ncbi:MAG: nitroreductase family protein [Cohaesibacter sp.]|nr:nitroreductase family protein [Cohaesibacter sp.]
MSAHQSADHKSHKLDFCEQPIAEMQAKADAFFDIMKTRRTVRDFSSRDVPRSIIERCVETAGRAPSGANQQPWTFACISKSDIKRQIREAAEEEERAFYAGRAGEEWLDALEHLGTDEHKPFLETAPWLIAIFGQRYGLDDEGKRHKHYYVPESVNIATGFLIAALHQAGLATLTHTPAPMAFLNQICERPENEKPYILLVVGYPEEGAEVPVIEKKSLEEISVWL